MVSCSIHHKEKQILGGMRFLLSLLPQGRTHCPDGSDQDDAAMDSSHG